MAIKNNILTLFFILVFFICAGLLNKNLDKPSFKVSKQSSALNISHELLSIFDLGQRRLFSDILWISTLLESDLEHYKENDLNSWLYLRFNTISVLDPLFLKNYQFGGQYLSIIKDDLKGAELIFRKGIKFYPDDYLLNFSFAFLLAFELEKTKEAILVYEKLKNFPQASLFVSSLIIKLKHKEKGDLSLTYELLEKTLENTQEPVLKIKLLTDLYAIKATLDLKCLNNNKKNCDTKDYDGEPYIQEEGKWKSIKEFNSYKLHIKRTKKRGK